MPLPSETTSSPSIKFGESPTLQSLDFGIQLENFTLDPCFRSLAVDEKFPLYFSFHETRCKTSHESAQNGRPHTECDSSSKEILNSAEIAVQLHHFNRASLYTLNYMFPVGFQKLILALFFKLEDTAFDRVFGREGGLRHTIFGGIGHVADSSHLVSNLVSK